MVTLAAFGWPFLLDPSGGSEASAHGTDAPWVFVLVLPLLAAIVLAELNAGGIDAKAIALLGMLASVGGALRALSPGVAGLEPSLRGDHARRPGLRARLRLRPGLPDAVHRGAAHRRGRAVAAVPDDRRPAGSGFLAGCAAAGCAAASRSWCWRSSGSWLGLLYGALMNLWFWPFGLYGDRLSFEAGAAPAVNLANYARYYLATSVIWDFGRGIFTFLLLLLAGGPLLRALRRVSRLANFEASPSSPHPDCRRPESRR